MQKFIITILLLFMGWTYLFAEDGIVNRSNVPLTQPEKSIKDHPRAPARIPVVCSHDEHSVFVESLSSLFANVTVEDESGSIVANTAAIISPDFPLSIPINEAGTFEITIHIEDAAYYGTFTL